ncbi:hypothetical protein [Modestobacter sp. SSW1-42]|uniref:hypothetical protein n=1 Tax=Modestobacter sp. SSW1-42 TaxID=596372 RepID=UPI0039877E2F
MTKEISLREDTIRQAGQPRAVWRFQPTPFVDGHRVAFAVGVFRHAPLPGESDTRECVIDVPDRWDVLSLGLVRMTEPSVEPDPMWTIVGVLPWDAQTAGGSS